MTRPFRPARHVLTAVVCSSAFLTACAPDTPAPTSAEPSAADVQLSVNRFEDDFNYGHIRGASLFVVHGINGRDLNLDESLPVDVQVNGDCAVRNLRFRDIRGAIQLPGGRYSFAVRLAAATPCTGTTVITANDVILLPGSNTSVVAHLSASGAPTASVFENDLAGGPGDGTLAVRHTANFSAVDVGVRGTRVFTGVTNGQGGTIAEDAGVARVQLFAAGARSPVFSARAVLLPNFLNVFYAVGTPSKGTFEVLHQAIFLFGRATARVSLLHGINGRDLGLGESLPVDIDVNGICAHAGVTFRTIVAPRPIAAGTYAIKVRLANAAAPCTGAVAISAPAVTFARGTYYTLAAHLTAGGAPTASVFVDDLASRTQATLTARHLANFGAVDVRLNNAVAFAGVRNGESGTAAAPAGPQTVAINPAGSTTSVVSARPTLFGGRFVNAFYAVGTPANGTFEVLAQRVFILF